MQESVAHAVASLPKPDRDLIRNLFWEGQTEAEIAAQLKVTQQAISKRKAVILKRLRKTLELQNFGRKQ
jgi:RNA polymerase sigma factor (sigma-70 family)